MSKNLILYFSGTGNSLSIALELQKKLGDSSVIPILSIEGDYIVSNDIETVGIVYPIYMNAEPRIISEFANRIKIEKSCYVYAIATHSGNPGKAGCHLHKVLKNKGIDLQAYFEITMINNTPKGTAPKFLMRLEWENDITKDKVTPIIEKAFKEIEDISKAIQLRDSSSMIELLAKEHGFNYLMMKQVWKLSARSKIKIEFLLDSECNGCGICEKVCTTNCIKLIEDKPHWEGEKCYYCYACFNFCPRQAIGVKYYTKKLGRYHYPSVGWEDIAAQKNQRQ
jgi:flavodoxin/Fe-S-cluster-containing hydrogenase component 2